MGESLSSRCSSFLLSWFSPLLGLMPPAISWSRSKKKSLAPFSELSAVVPSSSGVQGLAREGLVACAAKDIVASSTAGVVPTLARQSPTLANSQPLLLQQLLLQQLLLQQLLLQRLLPPQLLMPPQLQLPMPPQLQQLMPPQLQLTPPQLQLLTPPQLQLMPPQLQLLMSLQLRQLMPPQL